MKFELLDNSQVCWGTLDGFEDRLVFQTHEWMEFLAHTQRATPVIAALHDASTTVGYFSGLIFRRAGIRILGSPFPGWTTQYMGFNLLPHVPRAEALMALELFAFQDLKCLHLEVSDLYSSKQEGENLGFSCEIGHTLVTNLTESEETILKSMTSPCRGCIRKAEKGGVRIEEAQDEGFAEDYYEQLTEVFARQGLVPSYGLDRVKQLIQHILPTGNLLLLRARDPQGKCIATSIYVALNKIAVFWGNAMLRGSQHFRPNELINWHAMKYWKKRGLQVFDWGGTANYGRYKTKYGGQPLTYPIFRKSRFAFVDMLRTGARKLITLDQRLHGRLKSRAIRPTRISDATASSGHVGTHD